MKLITLCNGGATMVDDEDELVLRQYQWRKLSLANPYVYRTERGSGRMRYMAREIMDAPSGTVVDHIDRNPLNNCRANLRLVSKSDDLRNRRKYTIAAHRIRNPHESRYLALDLQRHIDNRGVFKRWLADRLGMSSGQMSHIVSRRRTVCESDARLLAELLQVEFFLAFELVKASKTLVEMEVPCPASSAA